MKKRVRRGDIWSLPEPGDIVGSEQAGKRPWMAISNNKNNEESDVIQMIPGTDKFNKDELQETHVVIGKEYGLRTDTVFMVEQIRTFDKQRLLHYITHVDDFKMLEVNEAMSKQYGMFAFFNAEYVKALCENINTIDEDSLRYNSKEHKANREKKLEELNTYCLKYGYNSKIFTDKYLIFKEVELVG